MAQLYHLPIKVTKKTGSCVAIQNVLRDFVILYCNLAHKILFFALEYLRNKQSMVEQFKCFRALASLLEKNNGNVPATGNLWEPVLSCNKILGNMIPIPK